MGKLCFGVISAALGLVAIICGCLVVFLFDPLVDYVIQKELILKEDGHFFIKWTKPPVSPYMRVYFFNVTNVEQYLRKEEKPNLDEVGPYTYREKWLKTNIAFNDNNTISYTVVKYYFFDRKLSTGPESDIMHTLNIPVLAAVDTAKANNLFKIALSSLMHFHNQTAFTKKNVSELLWGYEDSLLKQAMIFSLVPFKKFGYFYQKNGTASKLFNVYSGEDDMQKFTTINTYNYETHLNIWKTKACNMINGTDGSSFPPSIKKDKTLYIYSEKLCRSLPLVYEKDVEQNGIKGYRFTPPDDVFGTVEDNKENECFCLDGPPCTGRGLFDISRCHYNVSSFISWPHFYQADPIFRNAVTGMKPNKTKHQFYMDIAPRTGSPFAAQARMQINFQTSEVKGIIAVQNVSSLILPVLWFEDGLTSIPDDVSELLAMSSTVPETVKRSLMLGSFLFAGVFFLLATLMILLQQRFKKSKFEISHKYGRPNSVVLPHYSNEILIKELHNMRNDEIREKY